MLGGSIPMIVDIHPYNPLQWFLTVYIYILLSLVLVFSLHFNYYNPIIINSNNWLVVSNMTFIFHNIWDNPSH